MLSRQELNWYLLILEVYGYLYDFMMSWHHYMMTSWFYVFMPYLVPIPQIWREKCLVTILCYTFPSQCWSCPHDIRTFDENILNKCSFLISENVLLKMHEMCTRVRERIFMVMTRMFGSLATRFSKPHTPVLVVILTRFSQSLLRSSHFTKRRRIVIS